MVKCHYIPQLILRNFCKDNKIQYFDLDTKKIESRSTKSVFMEKGYYPNELEQDLCHNTEVQFANLLNNKILNERYRISLNPNDMLILKKFLIITMLRVRDEGLKHNIWYRELKRSGFIEEQDSYLDFFSGDFYANINRVLECKNRDSIIALAEKGENLNLFTYIKDVIYSYNVFVKSNNVKEDFVISDRGWAGYRGPLGVKKMNAMMNIMVKKGRYGGTFAYKDIAFEFASAISPVFKLFLIKEFQRLKEQENDLKKIEWDAKRFLSKNNYLIQTDAVKNYLIPVCNYREDLQWLPYAEEADLLNVALFGFTAKAWREWSNEVIQTGTAQNYKINKKPCRDGACHSAADSSGNTQCRSHSPGVFRKICVRGRQCVAVYCIWQT